MTLKSDQRESRFTGSLVKEISCFYIPQFDGTVLEMNAAILNQVLIPLAGRFESKNRDRWCSFTPDIKDHEEFQKCMAELVAEGSVLTKGEGLFRFSESGYTKYIHRIRAVRAFK